ncbi:MAG: O-succinylhomoserine sulfhydrylase [Gammaproteobacteria bacterium]|nr:O-succinylhomoserine sulfhydrylase [Gammaproteobacteria bacterium]
MTTKKYHPDTVAIRSGQERTAFGEHSEAIFATSSFVFESAEQARARFSYEEEGNVYSRFTNPSLSVFQNRLAELEGGEACLGTSSGMAAMLAVCMSALKAGDHVVSAFSIFGASRVLLSGLMQNFGVEVSFVDLTDIESWKSAFKENTKMVFFETPNNPLMEVADISAIADLAHNHNPDILVVVDNCFCSPILQKPLSLGADVVLHSATKYIDGQGRCVGGAVVGSESFVGDKVLAFMRTAGPSMSPFNAWVFSKGLETLSLRVHKACDNAEELARYLDGHSGVERVFYPGLETHQQYELAARQQVRSGAVVTFEVKGGREAAYNIIDSTELMSITANLGDTKTTITHPYTTTHARWSDNDKKKAGISEGMIRIAVGLEYVDDLIEDLVLTPCP